MLKTSEWTTHVYLFEEERTTRVRVDLDTGSSRLTGRGSARCHPADESVAEIGDELATARALDDLALQLRRIADADMAAVGNVPGQSAEGSLGEGP